MDRENLRLELKSFALTEEGTFEGLLSPYGKVDQSGDRIVKGAYTKTIEDNGGWVPMLWQHHDDKPIGKMILDDREDGLWVKGVLEMGLQLAKDCHLLLTKKIVNGLSIGFKALEKKATEFGRDLLEIKLYEGSVVTFPCALEARVSNVKKLSTDGFSAEMDELQKSNYGYYAIRTLGMCLEDAWYNAGIDPDSYWDTPEDAAVLEQYVSDSIDQFKTDFITALKAYIAMTNGMEEDAAKALVLAGRADFLKSMSTGRKAGRKISAETKKSLDAIQNHIDSAKTLLGPLLESEVDDAAKRIADKDKKNAPITESAADDAEILREIAELKESMACR